MKVRLSASGVSAAILLADALKDIAEQSADGADLSSNFVDGIISGAENWLEQLKEEVRNVAES